MTKLIAQFLFALLTSLIVTSESSATNGTWKVVPSKEVCMVTNMYFGKPQIPVSQGSKTYYGCCENCKATLQNDVAARVAVDPYSKKNVDKSTAVIAASDDGSVLYFENQSNFKRYIATQSTKSK